MKRKLIGISVVISSLALYCFAESKSDKSEVAKLTRAQVEQRVNKLEKIILPSKGTLLKDVEAVYGKLKTSGPRSGTKTDGRVYYYRELLTPRGGLDFRAVLLLRAGNGRVTNMSINHVCVLKNRRQLALGPHLTKTQKKEMEKVQKELEKEQRGVLLDLLEIHEKYKDTLKNASWAARE